MATDDRSQVQIGRLDAVGILLRRGSVRDDTNAHSFRSGGQDGTGDVFRPCTGRPFVYGAAGGGGIRTGRGDASMGVPE